MSEPITHAGLSALVRSAREAAGLTIQELADRSGSSYPTISRIELGSKHTPTASNLAQILETLQVPRELIEHALADDQKLLAATLDWMKRRDGLREYRDFINAGTMRYLRGSDQVEDLMLISPQDVVCRVQIGGPGNTPEALRQAAKHLADAVERAGWQVRVLPEPGPSS